MKQTDPKTIDLQSRPYFVWDYDITWEQFLAILEGKLTISTLDRTWAAVRLIEYAPYEEMIRLIGYKGLVEGWPQWRKRIRAKDQQTELDFLVQWVTTYHPELLTKKLRPYYHFQQSTYTP